MLRWEMNTALLESGPLKVDLGVSAVRAPVAQPGSGDLLRLKELELEMCRLALKEKKLDHDK